MNEVKFTSESAAVFTCTPKLGLSPVYSIGLSRSSPRQAEITPAKSVPSLVDFVNAKEPPVVVALFQNIAARWSSVEFTQLAVSLYSAVQVPSGGLIVSNTLLLITVAINKSSVWQTGPVRVNVADAIVEPIPP